MSLAERIAHALHYRPVKVPTGWKTCCPCHEDKDPSMCIADKTDGSEGVMVSCKVGCDPIAILKRLSSMNLLPQKYSNNGSVPSRKNKYEGAKFFVYTDVVGNPVARVVKIKNPDGSKKMWLERYDGHNYIPGLDGLQVPLYNLPNVVKADVVYLCEGEKDADTIIAAGCCGTSNAAGASTWKPYLTEYLKNKTVICCLDNDGAGKKRLAMITRALSGHVKELRAFLPPGVKEKGDVTDWVEIGGNVHDILNLSVLVEKQSVGKKASTEEYFNLFEEVFDGPRKCIFSDKLMRLKDGIWNPCINDLEIVKSVALTKNETREDKFQVSNITPHFFAYEASKKAEFLVDIPEWDGEDRISAMAYLVKLKPEAGITSDAFSQLLKEWCARVFKRLHDPMIQNRILVLQGAQGIGKDTWTSMLVDGLGQFCIPLSVMKEDKDTYLSLHNGLVMKISEFDRTAKTEVSTLKDIITTPSTHIRAPYDKDAKLRYSRCSFISSANANQLLRDSTGNRRFMIFELDRIEYAYHGWDNVKIKEWQMQCLAEMVELAKCNYVADAESWRQMNEYIESETPEDYQEDLANQFLERLKLRDVATYSKPEVLLTDEPVTELISYVASLNGVKFGTVKNAVREKFGTFRRLGEKRIWVLRIGDSGFENRTAGESFEL